MSPSMKELGIDKVTKEQRIALAMEIWDSLGEDRPSSSLSPKFIEELERRDAELEAHPEKALSWKQIRLKLETV